MITMNLIVENQIIGRVEGLNFIFNNTDNLIEKKKIAIDYKDQIIAKIKNIVDQLYETPDTEFFLITLVKLFGKKYNWKTRKRGNLIYKPNIKSVTSGIYPILN